MTQEQTDKSYIAMAHTWALNSCAERLKVGAIIVKDRQIISDGFNGTPSGFDNVCEEKVFDGYEPCSTDGYCPYNLRCSCSLCEEYGIPHYKLVTKPDVLHAEANAITKLAKSTQSSVGSTLYLTDSPCFNCSKLIIQAGIKRVVYDREYRDDSGIKLLEKAGVEVVKIGDKYKKLY